MTDAIPTTSRLLLRRRTMMGAGLSLFGWTHAPHAQVASGQRGEDQRLLVVILRGGMDGLAAVPVPGDPSFLAVRGITPQQQHDLREGTLPLRDIYALNRHLSVLHELYGKGEALIIHAVASPSRERSHFAAQDVLESGLTAVVSNAPSGWLNRALQEMPRGPRVRGQSNALAVAPTMPLIMRGRAPVGTWQPQTFLTADADTIQRVQALYAGTDPAMAAALQSGAALDAVIGTARQRGAPALPGQSALVETVSAVVRIMARPDGPRVATMNIDGWDTHIDQGFDRGRIGGQMRALDYTISALKEGLAPVWSSTAVLIVTEFGRTVRINGSAGTDHGTATIALLVGGAVKGGRVLADWPGLAPNQLFEGRDIAPTTDLRAVFKGVLAEHVGVPRRALDTNVFPDTAAVQPLTGLVKT
ncbi:DUF1501 domain-containing protein [Roseococcus sp. YIM B11640]|uniref:DUF1501 domain-containing protein n=1 Tax=Roseococcus sp. YIM B11640 TaxID=3133973 RepID=UPI003C7C5171